MNISELKEKLNLSIKHGNGKSIDNPIVIEKKESTNYVEFEYLIISHLLKIDDNCKYVRSNQRLMNYESKKIDYLKIKITDKENSSVKYEEFYFDITKVY
jgi:hypothetical protein|tara:strand:- start:112 stop:411 length:300 start_codon:yes stop_codon:yes gene_type:complete